MAQSRRNQKSRKGKTRGKASHSLSRSYESGGPDNVRVRGTLTQLVEKYRMMADDAQRDGDAVLSENHRQHQEHYTRLLALIQSEAGSTAP